MTHVFDDRLAALDSRIAGLSPPQRLAEYQLIPLEVFGALMIERPEAFPNLIGYLPTMASEDVQNSWTGSSGHTLMRQSVSFVRIVSSIYGGLTKKPLAESKILDFGCGWGRIVRLFYKYTTGDNIYGVDPWDKSITLCREAGLEGSFYISDYLPRQLPTPPATKFDLIYALSVFTHLSERATRISLNTLANALSDDGVLAITIRPKEYWAFAQKFNDRLADDEVEKLLARHDAGEFAFWPHNREKIEGEVTYGDSSFSLGYLENNFSRLRIAAVEWSESDPYQLIVFLKHNRKMTGFRRLMRRFRT